MSFIPVNQPNQAYANKYDALVWFIIGQPMSGKSTFANSFPNPLLINTDGNYFQFETPTIFIDKNGVDEKDANGNSTGVKYNPWEYFKSTISELVTQPNTQGYQTLILDLGEDIYEMCRQYILTVHKEKHESKIGGGFGQGYKIIEDEFMSVISAAASLRQKGWNVIILSHETIGTIKTVDEKVIDTQYESSLRTKVENKLKGISHITGRTDKISTVEQTQNGPVTKQTYVLNINEHRSIASNRMNLPFDQIYLSYDGWRNAINSLGQKNGEN